MVSLCSTDIAILPAIKLDKAKWDHCVFSDPHGSFFAAHDYLSYMAPGWGGLVLNDYQAVLPIIYNSKFGIKYMTGLPFVKQLGLMGDWQPSHKEAVFNTIHRFAKYGDICFNQNNGALVDRSACAQPNYELDLNQGYVDIYNGYHKTLRKRLRRISQDQNLCVVSADGREVISRYQGFLAKKTPLDLREDFKRLAALLQTPFGAAHFTPYKVMTQNKEEVFFGLYGKDVFRIYKFMTAVTQEGRNANASAFALDHLIGQYAGTGRIFDFMGSALPGVRSFIESFGADMRPYYLYHYNHLPWPLKLFKR